MPLENQQATVIAYTANDTGYLVLCLRWQDFMPYVVWDARLDAAEKVGKDFAPKVVFTNGNYCHTIGSAMYQYARRGGDISWVNEEEINQ